MKAQVFGISVFLSLFAAVAQAEVALPAMSLVICDGTGLSAVVTAASASQAKINAKATAGDLTEQVQSRIENEVLTYSSEKLTLEVDLRRQIPGTFDFAGHLEMEIDGQRVAGTVGCHGVYTAAKAPTTRVWQ